ncbi:hypothetical protein Goshw_016251 [Gossypium schwendimanii]|uniref:Uncharacterized protein n=1 Tax=Gossypium schwendimanii TaxID=34291 RepID=A0A7J9N1Q4_GOSSC|nr:hypothetical protein [Gossypium schwendimanii]
MSREEFEQRWARKSLREMLSAVEECVGKLEESMEDARESNNALGESIDDLREQSRDFVTMCLTFQRDSVQTAMMMALKEETMATTRALSIKIEELKGELALYRAAVEKGVSSVAPSNDDVPKPKEFVGTRSACNVDNFLSSGKVARDNATRHSGGVCSRVQGTHAPSFRGERKRSITYFSKWIDAVGQTRGGTKRCPEAIGSHDNS